jgi:hypothetical protein
MVGQAIDELTAVVSSAVVSSAVVSSTPDLGTVRTPAELNLADRLARAWALITEADPELAARIAAY